VKNAANFMSLPPAITLPKICQLTCYLHSHFQDEPRSSAIEQRRHPIVTISPQPTTSRPRTRWPSRPIFGQHGWISVYTKTHLSSTDSRSSIRFMGGALLDHSMEMPPLNFCQHQQAQILSKKIWPNLGTRLNSRCTDTHSGSQRCHPDI